MDQAADVARFATHYDHVAGSEANLLDRALAECPDKTAKAETACVRDSLAAAAATHAPSPPCCRMPGRPAMPLRRDDQERLRLRLGHGDGFVGTGG